MSDQTAVPPSAPSGQPAPAKAARKRRRWPWVLLGILVLILLLIALLPTIASTGPVRSLVLGRVNQQLNGTASVDSWSFGWFSGFKLSGIRVADAQGRPVVEIQSVTLPATVSSLLSSQKRLGAIAVESPKADIVLYADGTNSFTRLIKPAQSATPPAAAAPAQPLGFDVAGDIAVKNGQISVQPAGAAAPFLVRDLDVDVKIESLEKPIRLDLKAALGEERAPLAVKGSATVLHAGKPDPNAVEAEIAVTLGGLEIGPISALARQYGSPVEAGGILTVQKLSAQVQGMDSIKAAGDIELKQLALAGGPLGKDRPKFDHVLLAFEVSKTGPTLEIKQLKFDSPAAAADASGTVQMPAPGKLPKGRLAAHAQVNLAPLAAQLPETLKLQKGLTIESGAVTLDARLDSDEKGPRVDASLRVENVAAINQGKRIVLEAPIALGIEASLTDKGPRLDDLHLTSSFAGVTASGSWEKFDLVLTSDLEAALREAAKFVDLSGKSCAGRVSLALHVAGPERQKSVSGDVTVTGLALTGFTPGPVNLAEAKVTLGATALLDEKNALQSISGLNVDLAAPFATGAFSAESIALAPGRPLPALRNGKLSLNADLGGVARFAGEAGLMPAGIGLGGQLSFDTGLAVDNGIVRLAPISLTLTDLDAAQGRRHFRDQQVTLGGSIEANPSGRSLKVSDLKCDFSDGSVAVESLNVPDWAAAPAGITATITGGMDLERMLASLQDFAALPPGMSVAGQAKFTLKPTALADKLSVSLDAAVTALKVTPATGPAIEEPNLTFALSADVAPASQTLTLNSLVIKSSFYSLDAKGSLADWGKAQNLKLDGTQDCNLDKIGPLVAAFSGKPVEMSGSGPKPFHVVASLGAQGMSALLAAAIADAAVHADSIKYSGLDVAPLDVSGQLKDSVATVNLTGTVNGGALKLPIKVDASKPTPEFTLPPNTAILTEAKITPAMADEALSKALPIFKGCTAADGSISVDSTSLDVPLGADALQKAAFEGALSFKGVRMSAAGQLESILSALSLAGSGGTDLARIDDQRVWLSVHDGRIYQGPMTITLAGYTIKISGSVGLADKTLDMSVEIPITQAMVGGRAERLPGAEGRSAPRRDHRHHRPASILRQRQLGASDPGRREETARTEGEGAGRQPAQQRDPEPFQIASEKVPAGWSCAAARDGGIGFIDVRISKGMLSPRRQERKGRKTT